MKSRYSKISGLWYHGDAHKRSHFEDQHMDRPQGQDRNAVGPGIYFTRLYTQARGYAWPSGYVYTVQISRSARVMDVTDRPTQALVSRFIDMAPEKETGLSNWDENPVIAKRKAVAAYTNEGNLLGALVGVYNDFFGREPEVYARAMVKLGYDCYLHHLPEVDHLVVWNPKIITIVKEEKYEAKDE